MNPTQVAEILMSAVLSGDEDLLHRILRYARHMVEVAPHIDTNDALFMHTLRCNQCFQFNMTTGAWLPIERLWQASEDTKGDQHPGHNNWITIRN